MKTMRIQRMLFVWGLLIAAGATTAHAQPDAVERPSSEIRIYRRSWGPVLRIGTDYVLRDGEAVRDVFVATSSAQIEGRVTGDVSAVLGSVRLAKTAVVEGSLVVIGGTATIEPGAIIEQSLLLVGSRLEAPTDFVPGREHIVIGGAWLAERVQAFVPWLTEGLLLARPLVPRLGWLWAIVAILFLISLALTLIFLDGVRACAEAIAARPLSTFLVGLLVLLLSGPVSVILAASVVGLAVVPVVLCAMVIAWIIGKVGVAVWIGGSTVGQASPGTRPQAVIALAIGFAAITLAYMVPVLGFAVWALSGVLGLGGATLAFMRAYRRENPIPPKRPPTPPPSPLPLATPPENDFVAAPPPPADAPLLTPAPESPPLGTGAATSLLQFPHAAFFDRTAAFVLDLTLVAIVTGALDFGGDGLRGLILLLLVYFIAFWTWKGTTVGGIIVQLRVVRIDGTALRFSDALVRGLASLFSFACLGLGCLWILKDPDRQAWHDKIAGTYVVKVPRHWPL
jgi:uncharacterized RDD family membrane protein YckC